ncbi:pyridoxal-phosphate-dependent aminotransferase family protein [Celeribacter indicus]|uniref:Serine--glyoxylate transaminase n=1 Tax=Celeribacter indicus TaxID=1208324 RepID=A0A0B5DZ27_9RHOB|nr:aminotransferase class V-fold PLP-dependent enzyme [Celeribacter indicus]AJE45986.1 Serine--glyoxylate transaminase [Celeribacter indicus]SDW65525.1 alanine-glyoxylate transaminase / serine-glyoxylate transaminase / serine-pyruvate transaminase [Celeribacter indicus]
MTLANGRHYLAIPGPSVIPDPVLQAMHRPAPNIYTGELLDLTHSLVPDLNRIAGTTGNLAMYITNGHGLWEASLTNMISRGDRVLVCVTGNFGHGWAGVAQALGAQVEVIDFGTRAPVDAARLEEALRADTGHEIRAVLGVHVDTATSVRNDIAAMRRAIDAAGHPAVFAVDCIASLGCDRFEMDAWGVDVMLTASQKGLMTPPGMGFVWFSEKARAAGETANMRTPYWDWTMRARAEQLYQFFDGTPPTHHLYGLRQAVTMILEEGLENVWSRHATLAGAYWAAIDTWGQEGRLSFNIADPAHRSNAVTTLSLGGNDGTRLRDWLTGHLGITLGISLGFGEMGSAEADGYFRIGHMGHVNAHMVLGIVGAMETAFAALDIPHRTGGSVAAAQFLATAAAGETVPVAAPASCCA